MGWFLIGLLAPALWSITNHIDKYLLTKYFKGGGVGALMVFSSIVGVFLLPIIAIFHPEVLKFSSVSILIALNGFLYVLAVLPYFYALSKDETSIAVPLFQFIPVFSYVLAYFVLGEVLTQIQIIGGIFIILGAVWISLDLNHGTKIRFKKDVFFLMMISSLIFALNFLFFKYFAIKSDFWYTSFWEYIGFAALAVILMIFIKPYRKEFVQVIKENSMVVIGINGINEVINILAKIAFNIASLMAPITLIWIVNGVQPFFVFLYGVLLSIFFPKFAKEDISKKALTQKLLAIIIMFLGTYLISRY